jgi:hypothetical protein
VNTVTGCGEQHTLGALRGRDVRTRCADSEPPAPCNTRVPQENPWAEWAACRVHG